MANGSNGGINISKAVLGWFGTFFGTLTLGGVAALFTMYDDIHDLKSWKEETHPIEMRYGESQILVSVNSNTADIQAARMDLERIRAELLMAEASITLLEAQVQRNHP